ncbi:MAG: metallophosphoesterase [Elusimicrobia bacterium]|nr:metallophosphoesterase [Elusimicrobiota bacterium]
MRIVSIAPEPFETLVYHAPASRGGPEEIRLPFIKATVDVLSGGVASLIALADLQGYEVLPDGSHGRLAGQRVADELEAMAGLGMIPPLEKCGILIAGDMHSLPGCAKRGGWGDVREVWRMLAARAAWVAGVPGNHDLFGDSPEELAAFRAEPRMHFMNGDMVVIDGLRIAGIGGVMGNPFKPFRWADDDYVVRAEKLLSGRPDIFMIHEAPGAPDSTQQGNPVVAAAFGGARDQLIICGHKHWENPLAQLAGGAQVLNAHERVVVLEKSR